MIRVTLLLVLLLLTPVQAGLYYSAESFAEFPSRWRGFLLDHRALRQIAVAPAPGLPTNPLRQRYEQEEARLARLAAAGKATADDLADLGALRVRLGDSAKAVEILRPAQMAHPTHFRLAANLGTAWQLQGDLGRAAAMLELAVKLAPGKVAPVEQLHLLLVRLRNKEKPGTQSLDDLFGVSFVGPTGKYQPGLIAAEQLKRLPTAAIARVQQLALSLPADARVLWLLAELANATGDVSIAAAMMEGCVTEFGLRSETLTDHRRITREAAAALAKAGAEGPVKGGLKPDPNDKTKHEEHSDWFKPRSSRPLQNKTGLAALPPIDPKGVNALAWEVIAETTVDRHARPSFGKYLKELDGLEVVLEGYMHPLGDNTDLGVFLLIEHPIGCWFCEMPEMANIVLIELPEGKSGTFTRERIKVQGKLLLNAKDPENFLYTLREAKVKE